MKKDTVYRQSSEVTFREEFDGWGIVFNPETGEVFGLNPISVLIWKALDGKNVATDIPDVICNNITAMPEDAADQICAFIDQLARKSLIVPA